MVRLVRRLPRAARRMWHFSSEQRAVRGSGTAQSECPNRRSPELKAEARTAVRGCAYSTASKPTSAKVRDHRRAEATPAPLTQDGNVGIGGRDPREGLASGDAAFRCGDDHPRPGRNPSKGARHVLSAVPSFRTTFGAWWRKSTSRAQDLEQALPASLHDTIERSEPEHGLAR